MSQSGSGVRIAIGLGCVGLLLLVGAGIAGAVFYRSSPSASVVTERRHHVSLGEGRTLEFRGGVGSPLVVRVAEASGSALTERWSWTAPEGFTAHPWRFERRGDVVVGDLHLASGGARDSDRLEVFDATRGHLASLERLVGQAFRLSDDGTLIAQAGGKVQRWRCQDGKAVCTWQAPLAEGSFATQLARTPRHVVVWNGPLTVFSTEGAEGSPPQVIAPLDDVVGVAAAREEVLLLRGGRLVAVSLADGKARLDVELVPGKPLVDGLDDPVLLGARGGRWLIAYTTELAQSFSGGARSWLVPAEVTLAAVDPETGKVVWRRPLGRWVVTGHREHLGTDEELPADLLLYGERDEDQATDLRGLLAAVSLDDGALRWECSFGGASRSNHLCARRGAATYLRVRDLPGRSRSAIARFEGGRLTGAVWLPDPFDSFWAPGLDANGLWLDAGGWLRVSGPELKTVGGAGDAARVGDARAWVADRLALPPAAR